MGFFNSLKAKAAEQIKAKLIEELGMGGDDDNNNEGHTMTKEEFEATKPDELRKDIRMISGCADHQTSAGSPLYVVNYVLAVFLFSVCSRPTLIHLCSLLSDVSNVSSFQLPDPAGRAGGALTSTLLKVLYADEQKTDEDLSFTEVMERLRSHLKGRYSQIPQLSSMNPIDVETKFDLVPDSATGTRRAVMIGINYIGELDISLQTHVRYCRDTLHISSFLTLETCR